MNPFRPANRTLKHTKPQFSLGKTEVRSRSVCTAGAFLGSKIASVCHPGARQIIANNTISGIQWPKQLSHEVNYPFKHFHSPCYAKTMESWDFPWENSHFLVVTSSLCHPNSASLRSKIAHWTTPAANCPPSVANGPPPQMFCFVHF